MKNIAHINCDSPALVRRRRCPLTRGSGPRLLRRTERLSSSWGHWGGWQLPGRRRLEEAVTCYHVSICCVFQYLNTNPHTQPPPLDRPTSKVGRVTILGTFIYTSSFFRLLKSKLVDLDCCLSINLFIYLIYSNKIIKNNVCWMFYIEIPQFQNDEWFLTD